MLQQYDMSYLSTTDISALFNAASAFGVRVIEDMRHQILSNALIWGQYYSDTWLAKLITEGRSQECTIHRKMMIFMEIYHRWLELKNVSL